MILLILDVTSVSDYDEECYRHLLIVQAHCYTTDCVKCKKYFSDPLIIVYTFRIKNVRAVTSCCLTRPGAKRRFKTSPCAVQYSRASLYLLLKLGFAPRFSLRAL
jgi:hypothetical protein